jgi:hypothetical protein
VTGKLRRVLTRAKFILQGEGPAALLRRAFEFYIFSYGHYYLYRDGLAPLELNEADFLPKIEGFRFEIVRSNEEADKLVEAWGHDFRKRFVNTHERLDKGAIAFCGFSNGEIAHVGWMALTERAKETLFDLPLRVDFSGGECYIGSSETSPRYRGKGLMNYNSFRMLRFRRENGIRAARYAITVGNAVAQRAVDWFAPDAYARARFIRVLWWEFWKETPLA